MADELVERMECYDCVFFLNNYCNSSFGMTLLLFGLCPVLRLLWLFKRVCIFIFLVILNATYKGKKSLKLPDYYTIYTSIYKALYLTIVIVKKYY